jgi:SnoaL-like domain
LIVTPSNNILYLFYVIHLQKDGYETVEEINKLNGELYRAFASLSIEKMEKLWKRCLYTSRLGFMGWLAIRESWITIFSNTEMIRFTIKNTKIRIFDNKLAVVVCGKYKNNRG